VLLGNYAPANDSKNGNEAANIDQMRGQFLLPARHTFMWVRLMWVVVCSVNLYICLYASSSGLGFDHIPGVPVDLFQLPRCCPVKDRIEPFSQHLWIGFILIVSEQLADLRVERLCKRCNCGMLKSGKNEAQSRRWEF
jgi:hypothetical protein